MKGMKIAMAAVVAAVAALGTASYFALAGQSKIISMNPNQASDKILGYTVVDGKFADGPYKGLWAVQPPTVKKIEWSEAEWKEKLTEEQFRIMRMQGTEPPFCSPFKDNKKTGVYQVAGTGQPVFRSDAKFDSGTGWPSFFQPHDKDAIWLRADTSHGMVRMEVLASRCNSHLGHVFNDGPRDSTGLRFCINSTALQFVEQED